MANQRGESTSIGHFWNRCIDAVNNLFETYSFWTHAKDVEFDDGEVAQNKVGAINGITSDLSCEDESVALSAVAGKQLNDSLAYPSSFKNNETDITDLVINGYTATSDCKVIFYVVGNGEVNPLYSVYVNGIPHEQMRSADTTINWIRYIMLREGDILKINAERASLSFAKVYY